MTMAQEIKVTTANNIKTNNITQEKADLLIKEFFYDYHRLWDQIKMEPSSNKFAKFFELESNKKIREIGIPIIPFLIKLFDQTLSENIRFKNNSNNHIETLFYTCMRITKKYVRKYDNSRREQIQKYIDWWKNGYEKDITKFREFYKLWKNSKSAKNMVTIQKNMKDIGIRILPNVMKKIFQGDWQLLEVADYYTGNELAQDRKKADFESLSMQDKQKWIKKWWEEHKDLYSLDYKSLYEA